eukprot:12816542-Alexandrium_andersonii.AAC.1
MSASLVGSEMCIRDSLLGGCRCLRPFFGRAGAHCLFPCAAELHPLWRRAASRPSSDPSGCETVESGRTALGPGSCPGSPGGQGRA